MNADAHAPRVEVVAAREEQPLVEAHEERAPRRAAAASSRSENAYDGHPAQPDLERALDRVEQRLLARRVTVGALEPRRFAHRPLPSMTIATCAGIRRGSRSAVDGHAPQAT